MFETFLCAENIEVMEVINPLTISLRLGQALTPSLGVSIRKLKVATFTMQDDFFACWATTAGKVANHTSAVHKYRTILFILVYLIYSQPGFCFRFSFKLIADLGIG